MTTTQKALEARYASGDILTAVQQQLRPTVPETIENWLGRLGLLYGVPFEHLVPDGRMLPPESLRFFYLDTNWLEALVDGAFSIGVHSDRDIRYHTVMQHVIREVTDVAAGKLRRKLRDEEADENLVAVVERAGFLMRSAVVAGWPGLEVAGYRPASPDEPADEKKDFVHEDKRYRKLALLRLERLAPDLMLCIFAAVPTLVVMNEPAEDFHFGLELKPEPPGLFLWLRDPENSQRLGNNQDIPIAWRHDDEQNRVVDILSMQGAIEQALPGQAFNAAELALQMIDAPDRQVFKAGQTGEITNG